MLISGASARTLPNGRVATSSEQECVSWSPYPSVWRMRDQAAACERRSHSSKPMRPRRASPNGTSECSSTPPPKYRASGSLTTSRGSPTAFRAAELKQGVLRQRPPHEKRTSGPPTRSHFSHGPCLNADRQSDTLPSLEIAPRKFQPHFGRHQPELNRIASNGEHNRNCAGRRFGRQRCGCAARYDDYGHLSRNQIS